MSLEGKFALVHFCSAARLTSFTEFLFMSEPIECCLIVHLAFIDCALVMHFHLLVLSTSVSDTFIFAATLRLVVVVDDGICCESIDVPI